jgi:hypothetical protein
VNENSKVKHSKENTNRKDDGGPYVVRYRHQDGWDNYRTSWPDLKAAVAHGIKAILDASGSLMVYVSDRHGKIVRTLTCSDAYPKEKNKSN